MPVYEYECVKHGTYEEMRSIREASEPSICPVCQRLSRRVFAAPMVMGMNPLSREAARRNEKSRHDPHVCTSSCGHTHLKSPKKQENSGKLQRYAGARPWVIEHG